MRKYYDDPMFYQGRTIKQIKDSNDMVFWSIIIMIAILLIARITHAL